MKLTFKIYPSEGYESDSYIGRGIRFHITRDEDGAQAFTSRRPPASSEYWDEDRYTVWDNEEDCEAFPEEEEEGNK